MHNATLPVLFESTDNTAVVADPVNADWVAVVEAIAGSRYEMLARRYYEALYHLRSRPRRPVLPGRVEVVAGSRQQAFEGMLEVIEQGKTRRRDAPDGEAANIFVDTQPERMDATLPRSLRDPSYRPRPLSVILDGAGRPPCDALCLLRAFVAAPVLGVADNPTSVHRLLHSNPTFAHLCGFLGRNVLKQSHELTSRRLPSLALCEAFSEVMTRYGLWYLGRLEQVRENIASGAVPLDDTMAFDTTHIIANSHGGNVVAPQTQTPHDHDAKPPKQRKVPRMRKTCACGRDSWQRCDHPWIPTDHGAAVVVKGHTRVYWAHKASIATLANSEIPVDARVLTYAATSDGKTLLPHLAALRNDLPETLHGVRDIVADDAYLDNVTAVPLMLDGVRLTVPVHPRRVDPTLAAAFAGIDRFTPIGVPVCDDGHRFELRGRDLNRQRYIWAAPDGPDGRPVCATCSLAHPCTQRPRRHIRVHRADLPQIFWDHPQHFARNQACYAKRTSVERAIKRLKVDLLGETLTHRDAIRVQAHLDRKLLALHLLLAVRAQT
jgi:hypothetical protein